MKPQARISFRNALAKENLAIDFDSLTDKELKSLYLKLQKTKHFPYKMIKNRNFEEVLKNGELQYVSFRNTPNVRNMTLKEYLQFEDFCKHNKGIYIKNF